MRHAKLKENGSVSLALAKIGELPSRRLASIVVVLAGFVVAGAVVSAYNHSTAKPVKTRISPLTTQGSGPSSLLDPHRRLGFQPEADKFRRRLGKRFTDRGREHATLIGTLKIGAQESQVRIDRTHDDGGEQVDISLNGSAASLNWNGKEGARSAGRDAAGTERSLIERIALDSPDQFIFAQVRGASYYTIARSVAPAGAGDSYEGPIWDLVRTVEPQRGIGKKPQNEWRIYYINTSTGLIDKILYQDQGQNITVEMSEWVNRGGELGPSLIRWRRDGDLEMELSFSSFSHGPK